MAPEPSSTRTTSPADKRSHSNDYYDSLHREIEERGQKGTFGNESPIKNHRTSQSLSKSVFGYEIDRTAFQKQSYLSKILNDRL